jgi:hypothetical protein
MSYRKCPECAVAFIEHRRYEAPVRCPRCLMRTGTIVELIRHGYSRRISTPPVSSPLGARNVGPQIEG